MDLSKLNEVSRLEKFLPTKRLSDLEMDKPYEITNMRFVNTKYGRQVVADLEKNFSVFLPARTNHLLDDDADLFGKMMLRTRNHGLALRYLGGKYNRIEFIEL